VELKNHPDAFKAIEVAERHLEIIPRREHNPPRMPCKKAPLPGSVVLVNGIAVECADGSDLHKITRNNYSSTNKI
jgi:hypothetical protein